jgi:hypothetical protein
LKPLFAIGVHLILVVGLYVVARELRHREPVPPTGQLLETWDVRLYWDIAKRGYSWHEDGQSNVAFFPAFPYIWRYTFANVYGISGLNVLFFVAGALLLARAMSLNSKELMLALSMPSLMFMYVPYSEALFFLFSAVALYGYIRRRPDTNAKPQPGMGRVVRIWEASSHLTAAGLFLCCMTRAASNIFVPAIFITEWLAEGGRIRRAGANVLAAAAGVFLVAFVQHQETGEWLGFLETQRNWGHFLQWPQLPLIAWGGRQYLDGSALIAGLLAGAFLCRIAWRRVLRKKQESNPAFVFSIAYLFGITLLVVCFAGGEIHSLNRYCFATAFWTVAGICVLRQTTFSWKRLLGLFVFCWMILSLFDMTDRNRLEPLAVSAYLSSWLFLCHQSERWSTVAFYGLYSFNLLIQVRLLDGFLSGHWVA